MITVRIKGGLGNQLFQYAFGRAMAIARHDELALDTTGLTDAEIHGDAVRPFALDAFNVSYIKPTPPEIAACRYPYGILSQTTEFIESKLLRRVGVVKDQSIAAGRARLYYDGYWQSPHYFEHIRELLLEELTLKKGFDPSAQLLADILKTRTSVSIHVRRGDYAANSQVRREFGVCSPSYYAAAIAHMASVQPGAAYIVFSDDIAWVREHIDVPPNTFFVEDSEISDAESLMFMSQCTHNIIANSSFSWWGAWLNTHPEKVVVAPTPWFDTVSYESTLIPPSWIRLPKNQ